MFQDGGVEQTAAYKVQEDGGSEVWASIQWVTCNSFVARDEILYCVNDWIDVQTFTRIGFAVFCLNSHSFT